MVMYVLKAPILDDYIKGTEPKLFMLHAIGNAIDANEEVGLRPEEVEVEVGESEVRIRDKGKGLSPEEVEKIFSRMFYTTRRDLRQYVGRYGLGMKVMVGVEGGYVIRTHYGGWFYEYKVSMSPDGGVVCRLEGKEEREGVGTEIEAGIRHGKVYLNQVSWLWRKGKEKLYESKLGYGIRSSVIEVHTDRGLVYRVSSMLASSSLPIGIVLRLPHHSLNYGVRQEGIVGDKRNRLVLNAYMKELIGEISRRKQEEIDRCESVYEVFRRGMTWTCREERVTWRGRSYRSVVGGIEVYSIVDGDVRRGNEIDMWRDPKPVYVGNELRNDLADCYFLTYKEWNRVPWIQDDLKPYVTFIEPESEKKERRKRVARHFYGRGIMESEMRTYPINLKEGEESRYTDCRCLYEIYRWLGVECIYVKNGKPGRGWVEGEKELGKYLGEEEIGKILRYDDIRVGLELSRYDYLYEDVPLYRIVKHYLRGKERLVNLLREYMRVPEPDRRYVEREYPALWRKLRVAGYLTNHVASCYHKYIDLRRLWGEEEEVSDGQMELLIDDRDKD